MPHVRDQNSSEKVNFNTALLKPSLRSRSSNLFNCLNLPPRCLPCDTMGFNSELSNSNAIQHLSTARQVNRTCRAKTCRFSPWHDVGIYCDMHYLIVPCLCKIAHRRTTGRAQVSRCLIENVNGLKVLAEMSFHTFEWRNTDLATSGYLKPRSRRAEGVRCGYKVSPTFLRRSNQNFRGGTYRH